jgi:hypothetical protein
MPAGRPTDYTPELADEICAQLADGDSLRAVCNSDSMPSKSTVFRWLRTNEEFRDQYARAKEESADAMADEVLDIADDGTNDWMERLGKDGDSLGWQLNGEHVQRSKLRIDTRKFLMSKMKPKKYGDKVDLNVGGQEGGKAIEVKYVD